MRLTIAAALLCSVFSTVQAQQTSPAPSALRPFVGIGYTSGGETLVPVTVKPRGGSAEFEEDVSAGAGVEARVGLSFRLADMPVSVRASYGIHNDQSNGIDNDRVFFRRYPLEVLGFYHFSDRASLGVGLRRATRPTLRYKNANVVLPDGSEMTGFDATYRLQSATGIVLEGEWRMTPSWGVSVRYVKEYFKVPGARIDADHVGVNTQWYFR